MHTRWILFLTALACFATFTPAHAKANPPNVLLVFIDDMGWADLSSFGNTSASTPNIDRLAAEGIRFEQFYVNSPICSPSRVAITTGQYPQRWNITSYLSDRAENARRGIAQWLDPAAPTLPSILRDAGYATGHFGKWHMGGQRDVGDAPLIAEYGFDASLTNFEGLGPRVLPLCDAYDGEAPRPHALGSDKLGRGPIEWDDRSQITARFTRAAIDFIERSIANDQPFYVNLWPDDVHSPFFPPAARRGNGAKRTLYHGVLETMDQQLGVLFDRIRNDVALRDNTLILLCSDNGPETGAGSAGPFRGSKAMLYEGGIRSPLIVWGPGIVDAAHAGSTNRDSVIAAIDLVPSILQLTAPDRTSAAAFDGESIADTLIGRSSASRSAPIFFSRPPDRRSYSGMDNLPDLAMREDKWKLLCDADGTSVQLYDLSTDPGETKNLASKRRKVTANMLDKLLAWNASIHAQTPRFLP